MLKSFCVLLVAVVTVGHCQDCVAIVSNHKTKQSFRYDLSPLMHTPELSDYLVARDNQGGYIYTNPCMQTTTACIPPQTVCRRSNALQGYGTVTTQIFHPINITGHAIDKGVTIEYSGGSACNGKASSRLHVLCMDSQGDPYASTATVSSDGCVATMTIRARAGCGVLVPYVPGSDDDGGKGISGASVFLILLFVAAALYVAVGCVVNWKVRGRTGFTGIFPNWTLWSAIPGLVKDGALYVAHGFKKGDYTQM